MLPCTRGPIEPAVAPTILPFIHPESLDDGCRFIPFGVRGGSVTLNGSFPLANSGRELECSAAMRMVDPCHYAAY
ncbi:hypothetical protein GCM10011494_39490 [Novosphingobium endophyticum]|uniref:Uncharacterized protein n=1 Tax=Novosphingobium endophyticum TaxID=1955250 RepID=A0A916TWR4_9SPHN|nr:hypothetical protein GCM10011494_39490 [Novosphingobium endophyticum]